MPKIRLSWTEDKQDSNKHPNSSLAEQMKSCSSFHKDYGGPGSKTAKPPSKRRPGDPDSCPLVTGPHRIHGSQVLQGKQEPGNVHYPVLLFSSLAGMAVLFITQWPEQVTQDLVNKCIVSVTASLIQLSCGLQQKCCLNALPVMPGALLDARAITDRMVVMGTRLLPSAGLAAEGTWGKDKQRTSQGKYREAAPSGSGYRTQDAKDTWGLNPVCRRAEKWPRLASLNLIKPLS